jgi:multidrug efflux system membrane fusion protein
VLVLPLTAVVNSQRGSVVYVVDSSGTAHLHPVEVERSADSLVVLRSGVDPGELVVTDGQLRLTDGSRVSFKGDTAASGPAAP